jgi:hypothetical protein
MTTMGFDGYSFDKFSRAKNLDWLHTPLRDRPKLLMDTHKTREYYTFLERESQAIGNELRTSFRDSIPGCKIMCYMPHIQISWFYKGLVKGLAQRDNPVKLLTFNSEFCAHQPWFKKQETAVTHSSVIMLAKIQSQPDVKLVAQQLLRHGSVWFNKASRTIEDLPVGDWRRVEKFDGDLVLRRQLEGFVSKLVGG